MANGGMAVTYLCDINEGTDVLTVECLNHKDGRSMHASQEEPQCVVLSPPSGRWNPFQTN